MQSYKSTFYRLIQKPVNSPLLKIHAIITKTNIAGIQMLKQMAQSFYRSVLDEVGVPASLSSAIQDHPALRQVVFGEKKTASSRDIQQWENLGRSARGLDAPQGVLVGWTDTQGSYASIDLPVTALSRLVTTRTIEQFTCDITEIETLGAAKSNLSEYSNLDEFAEQRCANLLGDISKEGLLKMLEHDQIRSVGANATDTLSRYGWDGRLNLLNEGGAHHFAAARYIAKRMDIPVPICTTLHEYVFDPLAVAQLNQQFDIFAIGDPAHDARAHLALQDAFKKLRATFFTGSLPWSTDEYVRDASAIFLLKNDRKSERVAEVFRKEGFMDLGQVLESKLAVQQSANKITHRRSHQPSELGM